MSEPMNHFRQATLQLHKAMVLTAFIFCALVFMSNTALAASAETPSKPQTHKMLLSHHDFETWAFTPKPGDRIEITNQSDIAHSIYITYPDGTIVTLGVVQLPGKTAVWEVPAAGDYVLQCWIHTIIRAKLTVIPEQTTVTEQPVPSKLAASHD